MAVVYVEQFGKNPSCAFLREIYTLEFEGRKVEYPEGKGVIYWDTFEDCVKDGDLEFYKWILKRFSVESFSYIYSKCLINYIEVTEETLCLDQLRTECDESGINEVEIADLIKYVNWLIANGRAYSLSADSFTEIVEGLILAEEPALETLQELLVVVLLMSEANMRIMIESLLESIYTMSEHAADKAHVLLDRIGELGILSSRVGREVVTTNNCWPKVRDLAFSPVLAKLPILTTISQLDTVRHLKSSNIDSSFSDALLQAHTKYDMVILKSLTEEIVGGGKTDMSELLLNRMIYNGHFPSSTLSRGLVMEVTREIFYAGDTAMIKFWHGLMPTNQHRHFYLTAANDALRVVLKSDWKHRIKRATHIVETLGPEVDLSIFRKLEYKQWKEGLINVVIKQIKSQDQRALADICISKYIRRHLSSLSEPLDKFVEFMGERSFYELLRSTRSFRADDPLGAYITDVANRHPRLCLKVAIEHFRESRIGVLLFRDASNLKDRINITRAKLQLGQITYSLDEGKQLITESVHVGDSECHKCRNRLGETFFTGDNDRFDQYHCESCKDENSKSVTCQICLEDQGVDMKVFNCGHSYCTDCIARMKRKWNYVICSLCQIGTILEMKKVLVTPEEAIEKFMREFPTHTAEAEEESSESSSSEASDEESGDQ